MNIDFIPDNLVTGVRYIGEEVKKFAYSEKSYHGVTQTGFLFDIIQGHSLQGPILDANDFCTYMWARCTSGFYLLRQRFINKIGREWFLEAEIIPVGNSWQIFQRLREIFNDDPGIMDRICGAPHKTMETDELVEMEIKNE
jgi:hypothetical protein